jgi:hypothetical protein
VGPGHASDEHRHDRPWVWRRRVSGVDGAAVHPDEKHEVAVKVIDDRGNDLTVTKKPVETQP